jgi:choline dehydrogenase-like flavoprotein
MTMAETCIECDVAIVGSGFAGALIANELSKTRRFKVVVLEAGPGVPPNINDFMRRFYKAAAKVPESLIRRSCWVPTAICATPQRWPRDGRRYSPWGHRLPDPARAAPFHQHL